MALFLKALNRITRYNNTTLKEASLELTYRCNMRCQTCGVWRKNKSSKREMTLDEIQTTLDQLKKMGTEKINLIGAEPFMRKDIIDIISNVKERGFHCTITTNGVLLTDDIIKKIVDLQVDLIGFSIDAPDYRHDTIRGGKEGTLEKSRKAIENLISYRNSAKKKYPEVNVHCTVSVLNYNFFSSLTKFVKNLDVNKLSFQYLAETPKKAVESTKINTTIIASDRFLPFEKSLLLADKIQTDTFYHQLDILLKETKTNGNVLSKNNIKQLKAMSPKNLTAGIYPVKQCRFIHNNLIINPSGDAVPCPNLDNLVLGNVTSDSICNIWEGEKKQQVKKSLKKKLFPICKYCCVFSYNLSLLQRLKFELKEFIS